MISFEKLRRSIAWEVELVRRELSRLASWGTRWGARLLALMRVLAACIGDFLADLRSKCIPTAVFSPWASDSVTGRAEPPGPVHAIGPTRVERKRLDQAVGNAKVTRRPLLTKIQLVSRKRIGQILLERGAIDEHQLQAALGHQRNHGGRLGEALVAKGFLSEDALVTALGEALALPVVELPSHTDPTALRLLKSAFCETHHVFPLQLDEPRTGSRRTLTLAVADPLDIGTVEEVEFITGCRVKSVLCAPSQIRAAIARHYFHKSGDEKSAPVSRLTLVRAPTETAVEPTLSSEVAAPEEEVPLALTEEVTSRTELADLILEHERGQGHGAPRNADENMRFLVGETDGERFETLERKFWALMRLLAKKGLLSKEEFLAEFEK